MFPSAHMHICKNPIKNPFEIVKFFYSKTAHQTQGDLYSNDIRQGYVRIPVGRNQR